MNIYGKFVTLRAFTRTDMAMLCNMFNDPDIERDVVGWCFPLSIEQQNHWFDTHLYDERNQRFIIDTAEFGPVGVISLTDIDWKNRTATDGIKLCRESCRGKGIGTDALMALLRYAFDELGLHRVSMTRLEENERSRKLHEKCGFKTEGLSRECIYKRGGYHNLVFAGVTKSDYRNLIAKNHYWGE